MLGVTEQELNRQLLLPVFTGNCETSPSHFVDLNHPLWEGDLKSFLHRFGVEHLQGTQYGEAVFARCTSSTKLQQQAIYYPLTAFPVQQQGMKISWERSIPQQQKAVDHAQIQATRSHNMQFVRMYMMGGVDTLLRCPILGIQTEGLNMWGVVKNDFVGHHFRFVKGVSILKDGADPGNNLAAFDYTRPRPESWKAIKDMTRTVFMCSTAHDGLHKRHVSGDIRMYENHELPWAWRSEANWRTWCEFVAGFGYGDLGDFSTWYAEQCNP